MPLGETIDMSTSKVTQGPANGQFLRFVQLVLFKPGNPTGINLTGGGTNAQGIPIEPLRVRFEVRASDVETPNTLVCRVYNLAPNTMNQIVGSTQVNIGDTFPDAQGNIPAQQGPNSGFTRVVLTAGYVNGNQGTIFEGNIKRYGIGRERNVDSYLDIYAGDGDLAYIQSVINQSFPKGTTDSQLLSALAKSMGIPVDKNADGFLATGGVFPRGKVQFGMARDFVRNIARNHDCRWSIQNGALTLIPNTGYLPGQAVKINSASGMIGTPEQTDNGITVRCYLNPLIKIGAQIQINNADINKQVVKSQFFPNYASQYYPATTTNDGFYRVLVAEHVGDTRGNDWYTELTCLDIDPSSSASNSVLLNG